MSSIAGLILSTLFFHSRRAIRAGLRYLQIMNGLFRKLLCSLMKGSWPKILMLLKPDQNRSSLTSLLANEALAAKKLPTSRPNHSPAEARMCTRIVPPRIPPQSSLWHKFGRYLCTSLDWPCRPIIPLGPLKIGTRVMKQEQSEWSAVALSA